MYIKRVLEKDIKEGAQYFPVVAILGPRQSGKTTIARELFSNHRYVSLEEPDIREIAISDPRAFLEHYTSEHGMIIDEFQHAPQLLSYIQTRVDHDKKQGYFVLTGSQNFLMNQAISQSLAGRVSLHTLLPFSIEELKQANLLPQHIEEMMYKGFYPATYTKQTPHDRLYAQYLKTYIERDVRQLAHVGDLTTFQTFLALCAERAGQLVNFTQLANDCRISDHTVRRWLTILEASYIIFLLRPYEKSFGKRLIKSPKLYFYDSGLICFLLKMKPEDLVLDPKKRNIFESLVIADIIKNFYNKGTDPAVYFWQDRNDHEVDCIIKYGTHEIALEIKSGRTVNKSFFASLKYWHELNEKSKSYVIYGGNEDNVHGYQDVLSWQSVNSVTKFLDK